LKSVDGSSIGEESSSSTALASDADDPNGRSEPPAQPVRGLMDTPKSSYKKQKRAGNHRGQDKKEQLAKIVKRCI